MTKNQWMAKEMVSQHRIEVAAQNEVDNKIARSRHGTEVATHNLLRSKKNMVTTKINVAGNINDVET